MVELKGVSSNKFFNVIFTRILRLFQISSGLIICSSGFRNVEVQHGVRGQEDRDDNKHLGEGCLEGGGDGAVDEEVGGDVEHDEQVGHRLEAHHPEGGDVLVVLPDAGHLRRDEHDDHGDPEVHDNHGNNYS